MLCVGTPGRILDLAYKKVMSLSECSIICLDEADKLLSVDFQPVIEKMLRLLPKHRQILLFSATFPQIVKSFKETWMPDAHIVNLMEELTLKGVTQYYVFLEEKQKIHCLNTLFSKVNKFFLITKIAHNCL
jgi:ATP-dependent RNA helicase DDX6/DHH1